MQKASNQKVFEQIEELSMRKLSSRNRQGNNKVIDLLAKIFVFVVLECLFNELLEKMGLNSDTAVGISLFVGFFVVSFIIKNELASTVFRLFSGLFLAVMVGRTALEAAVVFVFLSVVYFALKNRRKQRGDMFSIDPYDYEGAVAQYLRTKGYREVNTTPKSGDYGADVLAVSPQGSKVCVQCKRYQEGNPVGVKAVQEIFSAKEYYKCDLAYIFTTSDFTKQAREMAAELGVKLVQYR